METSQVSSVQPDIKVVEVKKKPFNGGFVVGMLLFLIICLFGGLTYFVLKDRGINLLSSTQNTSTNPKDVVKETDTTKNTPECPKDETKCAINLENSGWSLYSLPEYGFSMEIPSYTMTAKIGTEDVASVWKVGHSTTNSRGYSLYSDYLHSVNATFYPTYIPEGTGCGQGCVKEHSIYVNIHENKGSKEISEVKDIYYANWKKSISTTEGTMEGSIVSKWGMNVWSFKEEMIGGTSKGYLIATKGYVYEIKYYFSTEPAISAQTAQKVLDSIKF